MAEKYLKALLQELGQPVLKTHNLLVLLQSLVPHAPTLAALRRRLLALSQFAVDFRYPGGCRPTIVNPRRRFVPQNTFVGRFDND